MEPGDDFGSRSGIDFETIDEPSWADRDGDDEDIEEDEDDSNYDSQHDIIVSANASVCCIDNHGSWPRTYRKSMDMLSGITPPATSFLRGNSVGTDGAFSHLYKRPVSYEYDSSLAKPFIEPPNLLDMEKGGASSLSPKLSIASSTRMLTRDTASSPCQCSFGQVTLNSINVMYGMGLLSTPYAIQQGGWSNLLLLVGFRIIACYTCILFQQCLESSKGLQTYPDIGEAAFGKAGRFGIAIILYMDLYATCVEYIIMMSDNLSSLFPNTHAHFAGFDLEAQQVFAILMTLVVLPTVWLRDLSLLSYISAGGVITSILLDLCFLWIGLVDQVGFHPDGMFLSISNLPSLVTPVAFCLEELLPSTEFIGNLISIFIRILLVISTFVVALVVPLFGVVMALIGSFLAMLRAFIIPSVCTLILLGNKQSKLQIAACTLNIVIGMICGAIRTYSALTRVANQMA